MVAAFFYNYNEKHHCPTQCRHAGHMHTSHRVPAGPAAHCTASAVRAVRPHGCWPMHACSLTTRVDFGAAPARVAPDPASCPSTGPLPPPSSRPQNRRACIVGGHHQRAVQRDRQAAHGGADLGHELAAARVGGQVPHADVAVLVACARRRWAGLSLPAPARAARQRPPVAWGRAATENACSFIIGQPRSQRRAPAWPPLPASPISACRHADCRAGGAARARDQLALVGVQRDGVDGRARLVLALAARRAQVPDAHRAVLRARVHPLAVLLEAHLRPGRAAPRDAAAVRSEGLRRTERRSRRAAAMAARGGCGQGAPR